MTMIMIMMIIIITGDSRETATLSVTTLPFSASMRLYAVFQKKRHLLYFYDNFPKYIPIQIIFGRNIAEGKLTMAILIFIRNASVVYIVI